MEDKHPEEIMLTFSFFKIIAFCCLTWVVLCGCGLLGLLLIGGLIR